MTLQPEAGGESAVLNAQDTGIGNHLCSPPPALVCRIASTIALADSVSEKSSPRHHKLPRVIFKELKCYKNRFIPLTALKNQAMAKKTPRGKIIIDKDLCKGCYLCISVCPQRVITTSEKLNQKGYYPAKFLKNGYKEKKCNACTTCAIVCPDLAIEVYRE